AGHGRPRQRRPRPGAHALRRAAPGAAQPPRQPRARAARPPRPARGQARAGQDAGPAGRAAGAERRPADRGAEEVPGRHGQGAGPAGRPAAPPLRGARALARRQPKQPGDGSPGPQTGTAEQDALRGPGTMSRLGKILVIVNLGLSVVFAAGAAMLYLNRTDLSATKGKDGTPDGALVAPMAEDEELSKTGIHPAHPPLPAPRQLLAGHH